MQRVAKRIMNAFNHFQQLVSGVLLLGESVSKRLDTAEAFDTVWHSSLTYKMIEFKFATTYMQFIMSYLRNRTVTVHFANNHSSCQQVNSTVPKGTKLVYDYT